MNNSGYPTIAPPSDLKPLGFTPVPSTTPAGFPVATPAPVAATASPSYPVAPATASYPTAPAPMTAAPVSAPAPTTAYPVSFKLHNSQKVYKQAISDI